MSAELVDPFATQRLKVADMREDINARIAVSQQNDPPLCPQLVQKTLTELARAAEEPVQDALTLWARWLLEQLHHRAVDGIPYGEPAEPDWSLDSEERRIPGSERR
jgi:hypothetical protein